jgi:inner membrane protein
MAGVGHIAVGMAAARWRERRGLALAALAPSMLGWALISMLPDSDVIAFSLGVPYESILGHRGITHSMAFALIAGIAVALVVRVSTRDSGALTSRQTRPHSEPDRVNSVGEERRRQSSPRRTGLMAAVVLTSHGLLDSLTDGGRGVALLWPFSDERFFAPWHPIPVSPIGLGILTRYGAHVAVHELLLFAPILLYALWPRRAMPTRALLIPR